MELLMWVAFGGFVLGFLMEHLMCSWRCPTCRERMGGDKPYCYHCGTKRP